MKRLTMWSLGTKCFCTMFSVLLVLVFSPPALGQNPYTLVKDIGLPHSPIGVALSPNEQYLVATHYDNANAVTIVRLSDESKRTVPVPSHPAYAVFTPDSSRFFVSTFHGRTVEVIETTTGNVLHTVSGMFSYGGPYAMDIHPGGGFVYVTDGGDNGGKVVRINTSSYATKNIPVGSSISSSPYGIIFSPDGSLAYVSLYNDRAIAILDTSTDAVLSQISLTPFGGGRPYEMAITSDGRNLYVADVDNLKVWIIDTQTKAKIGEIPIGYSTTWYVELSPQEDHLLVSSFPNNHLSVVDANTRAIIQDINIDPRRVTFNGSGSTLYVANHGGQTISVFSRTGGGGSTPNPPTELKTTYGDPTEDPRRATISWKSSADEYEVELEQRDSNGNWVPRQTSTVNRTSLIYNEAFLHGDSHRWRVRARYAGGSWSGWSSSWGYIDFCVKVSGRIFYEAYNEANYDTGAGDPLPYGQVPSRTPVITVWEDIPDTNDSSGRPRYNIPFKPERKLNISPPSVSWVKTAAGTGTYRTYSIWSDEFIPNRELLIGVSIYGVDLKVFRFKLPANGSDLVNADFRLTWKDLRFKDIWGNWKPNSKTHYQYWISPDYTAEQKNAVFWALAQWAATGLVSFEQSSSEYNIDIRFYLDNIAFAEESYGSITMPRTNFTTGTSVVYTVQSSSPINSRCWGTDNAGFNNIVLHEIGHSLGLTHANGKSNGDLDGDPDSLGEQWSAMNYQGKLLWLGMSDIRTLRILKLPYLTFTAYCPVDIEVTDSQGRVVSKTVNDIPGATYTEQDIDGDGDPDDVVNIPKGLVGSYSIKVIPEPGASPTDTFTLVVSKDEMDTVIAQDVQIQDIPSTPHSILNEDVGISAVTGISIDIHPNRTPNQVFLSRLYTIYVAVLGSADFDVTTLDSTTVKFGRTGTEASPQRAYMLRDLNRDGIVDAMYGFLTPDCGFQLGDTEGKLTGHTVTGVPVIGVDSVLVSP